MEAKTLPEMFFTQASLRKNDVAFEYRIRKNEPYRSISWGHLQLIVTEIAYGLLELGLRKNDKVAIIAETRFEWSSCDLAILSCGGIVVPVYPTLPSEAVKYILQNSECGIVVVENKGQLQKIRGQWESLKGVRYAVVIDDFGDLPENDPKIISLRKIRDKGRHNHQKDPCLLERYINEVNIHDLATIIYTSGTTGDPKGVMLTHKNILSVINVLPKVFPVASTYKFLSFLPLSHVFERVVGLYFAISRGFTISYCSSVDQIPNSLKDSGANSMLVVPRILEKIYVKIESELKAISGFKKKLITWAFNVSENVLLCRQSKKYFSLYYFFNLIQLVIADFLVFKKIRKKLAPKMKYFISGSAPLSPEVAKFFFKIGIPVIEGYGLTETTAPATTNSLKEQKIGTVGKPIPGVEIKIAEDGEILIKGPNVFLGYYKDEEKTKEAFQDGWFKSGDIGEIDNDGYLKITDRKKDIIVTSSGKNIAPQNIENALKTSPYISNVIVIGDRRKYLSCLVTLDKDQILKYAEKQNFHIASNDLTELYTSPFVVKLIESEIRLKTASFAGYEQIKRFTIIPGDFTIESGEITPTLKVKRKFVENKYKDVIDAMYV